MIAIGTSERLSFVLQGIIRGGRAPREKHWLAATRTARLIVHAKASRIPPLVPHKPCPPEPDLKNNASKRGKCVDSRTDQRQRSSATRSGAPYRSGRSIKRPMRKGPDTEKAADQAFNQGLETRCGKDCPDRILIQGAPPKQTCRTPPEQYRLSMVRFGGIGMISTQIS